MAPLSEFERQRQENIQRNKDLLKKLELDSLNDSISRDVKSNSPIPKKRKINNKKPTVKKEKDLPSRRSRRLAGVSMEDSAEYKKKIEEEEEARIKREELDALKRTRLYGDFKLIDLMTDTKGRLKREDKVLKMSDEVKQEETEGVIHSKPKDEDKPEEFFDNENNSSDNKVLEIFRDLGSKFSAGDFYDIIRNKSTECKDEILESKRREFDGKKIFEKYEPNDIKITHQRITSINFHPSQTNRIITAGDKVGNVGIWSVDSSTEEQKDKDDEEENEPTIAILKPHGKLVSNIIHKSPSEIITTSYDGSIRSIDLNRLTSSDILHISDENNDLGISDTNLCIEGNPNLLYLSTLSGNFYQHDLRTSFKSLEDNKFLRLHDKKIGGFSINPNKSYQIASSSLDRSLRIWDLRNVSHANAKISEFDIDQNSPHLYGSYTSRLSISSVDWNSENRLVCNGYADSIDIFNLNGDDNEFKPVTEWSQTYQPGVKSEVEEIIPDNLKPLIKIKHNCQTGRWVSILKAKWQSSPSDGIQKFCIGNMNRGIDVYDQKGQILAHLRDSEKVGAVPAVISMHPTENWVVGGSASGKVYLFE